MSDAAAPLSYANRASNLAKEQAMPLQRAPAPKKAAPAAPLTSPTSSTSSASPVSSPGKPAVHPNPAQPPAKSTAPASASVTSPTSAASPSSSSPSSSAAVPAVGGGPVKVVKAPKQGYALVKAVTSGDTLVVMGNITQAGQHLPEKTIIISGIAAPKFAKGKNQVDEPFAWESREWLRKKIIGQQIRFDIIHTMEDSGREYATVWFKDENLAVDILLHGWAKVKTGTTKDGKERTGPEDLVAAQTEAQQAGRGVWLKGVNEKHHIRTITFNPDPRALFDSSRSTPIPAVVDQVRDGSTLRVELLNGTEPLNHTSIFLHLAGVQCPRTPLPLSVLQSQHEQRVKEGKKGAKPEEESAAEPWALEAQEFTELRLLHRDVQVLIQGTDKLGNFFGTILYPRGNISIKLLELGFGKLVPWSAALTSEADKLKAAEAVAKEKKLRVWSGVAPAPKPGAATPGVTADYQGKVIQVISGDSLIIADQDGVERKVSLASIRAPRLGRRGEKDEPFALEAKEHMRSKLVGHRVKVITEYVRPAPSESKDQEDRSFVTIFQGKLNMNESLVSAGLAEVIRHRVDEERSQFYDAYLSAEHAAQAAQRGKFGKATAPAKMVDLTDKPRPERRPRKPAGAADAEDEAAGEDEAEKKVDPKEEERANKAKALTAKARQYLSFLQRDKNITAIVEYVFTPSRIKLAIPKESIIISFALGGVRTPGQRDTEGIPDKIYEKALAWVRSRILQHTVRVEVEALDKGDNFLGSLFVGKLNLGVELLREGFASIVDFSARKSPYSQELFAAEAEAKAQKRGLWEKWTPPADQENKEPSLDTSQETTVDTGSNSDYVPVKVTEIEDANDFYVHFTNDPNVDLLESKLREFNPPSQANFAPHGGTIAAGQFNDGNWYRVRIESVTATGDYRVFFLDYGNHDQLAVDKLRSLPPELAKIPALAHHATLAGVSAPKGEDYKEAAALAFHDLVWGQELSAKQELMDFNKVLHLTLLHESSPVSINKQLLRDGNARVSSRPPPKLRDLVNELKEHQEFAKQNHYNIWEYGDVSDEEEDAKPAAAAAAPRKK